MSEAAERLRALPAIPLQDLPPGQIVYFLRCGDFVKVGYASDAPSRVRHIRVSNPYPVDLIAWARGGRDEEARIHAIIKNHRHKGEWFRVAEQLMVIVEAASDTASWIGVLHGPKLSRLEMASVVLLSTLRDCAEESGGRADINDAPEAWLSDSEAEDILRWWRFRPLLALSEATQ